MGLAQFARRIRVSDVGIIDAQKVFAKRVRDFHFDHYTLEILAG